MKRGVFFCCFPAFSHVWSKFFLVCCEFVFWIKSNSTFSLLKFLNSKKGRKKNIFWEFIRDKCFDLSSKNPIKTRTNNCCLYLMLARNWKPTNFQKNFHNFSNVNSNRCYCRRDGIFLICFFVQQKYNKHSVNYILLPSIIAKK